MAVSFATGNVFAEATAANTIYTAPSGIADGDLLLIWHFEFLAGSSIPTATPPTGWAAVSGTWPITQSSTHYGVYLWYKIASGESGDYTVTHASCVKRGIIARVTGNDTSTIFDGVTQNSAVSGGTTTYTGETTTVDGDLIMLFGADDNDLSNTYAVSGYTLNESTPGNCLLSKNLATAGATGSPTMTNNSSGSPAPWFAVMVAVKPAAGATAALPELAMAPPQAAGRGR